LHPVVTDCDKRAAPAIALSRYCGGGRQGGWGCLKYSTIWPRIFLTKIRCFARAPKLC
jgi:hypothetical protein